MKRKKGNSLISVVLALAVALYPFAWSGTSAAAPTGKDVMVLKPGSMKVTVQDAAGRAIAQTPMKLLDKDGKVVQKAVTDDSGGFSMSNLDEGGYTLAVGDTYNLKLALKEEGEAEELKVIVPEDEPIDSAEGFTTTHVLVGGIIIAIIVGVGVAVANAGSSSDDEHDDTVSP
jgi:ABC-type Fe3+ transport system substrate-binding protein